MTQNLINFIRATTRPFVTYALVGGVIYSVIRGSLPPEQLLTLGATAVGFWFADRKTANPGEVTTPGE